MVHVQFSLLTPGVSLVAVEGFALHCPEMWWESTQVSVDFDCVLAWSILTGTGTICRLVMYLAWSTLGAHVAV